VGPDAPADAVAAFEDEDVVGHPSNEPQTKLAGQYSLVMSSLTSIAAPDPRRWKALTVLVGAVLLLAIDGTVLYLAIPSLMEELNPSSTQILWIGDIYSLALAGLLVTMGTLADRIGRRRLLLIGMTGFGAASLLAAFAPNPETLIAARLLLGVAGATIMPSTLSVLRNVFTDPAERTKAIAIWSAAAGGGIALGPLVGGVLLENFWWGSVFLINVPVVAVLMLIGARLLPESRNPEPGKFDLGSSALSMLTMIPLVYAVKHGATDGIDATTVGCALFGLAAGLLFTQRQRKLTSPMIDVALFRNPAFSGAVVANFFAIFALTGLLFFFSQYVQLARGYSPLIAGLAEMPTTIAGIAAIALVGMLSTRLGRGRAIAGGLFVAAVGLLLIGLTEDIGPYVWLGLSLIPLGLGVGVAMTLTTDAVVSAVPPERAGSASAIAETAYELGVALGIAILGSIIAVSYRGALELPADVPGELRAAVEDSLASALHAAQPGSALASTAIDAFTAAMQTTSFIAAAITLVAAVIAWMTIPSPRAGAAVKPATSAAH
jgi:DHA2 family multidrug resistance protein-like MFS transporter